VVRNSAGTAIPQLAKLPGGAAVSDAAAAALTDAASTVAYVAAGVLLVGLLATLALPRGA